MAYDGYYLTYKADKETNERFDQIRKKYPSFRMVKINLEDWADPKIEQAARRQKVYVQNDMHKVNKGRPKNKYGRH